MNFPFTFPPFVTRFLLPWSPPTPQKKVLDDTKTVLAMDKKDPNKEDAVKELRKEINTWVANYRREPKVAGRPSFG